MNLPHILFLPIVPLILSFIVADSSVKQGALSCPQLPQLANVNEFLLIVESTFWGQITSTGLLEKKKRGG